jgi:hypothetical protein
MSDLEGQIGAVETDIHEKGGLLERIEALEETNNAIADDMDEIIWYLEECRNGTAQLGVVVAMLARVIESIDTGGPVPSEPPQAPEMFVPHVPGVNRAQRRRIDREIGRNGHER